MEDTRQYILNTLAYFDVFHYPLSKEEIHRFHGHSNDSAVIDEALCSLLDDQYIFAIDEFYALHNDINLATRRRKGNQLAAQQMKIADRAARILSHFPYVRGLAISGSLSKNFCTEKADIDFFIIAKANRLWVARTFMHLYKKFTYLTGKQKWFCMNYYVDEACLEIEEKNIFTAMEICTLLPMHGKTALADFMQTNRWTKHYLPGIFNTFQRTPEMQRGWLARFTESLLNNRFGNWLDDRFMKITQKRWQKKELRQKKNENGFLMSMHVGKHYSKPNPVFFQDKVVEMYKTRLEALPRLYDRSVKAV